MSKSNAAINKIIFEDTNPTRRPYERPKTDVRRKLTSWEEPEHKIVKTDAKKTWKEEALELGPIYSERIKKARFMAFAVTFFLVGFISLLTQAIYPSTVKSAQPEATAAASSQAPAVAKDHVLRYKITPIRVKNQNGGRQSASLPIRATRGDILAMKEAWPDMAKPQ
ncbi:MAG: hypothetical protein KDD66_17100 [Bdellovibrionales bacterium]|nr:hypothetical protein [Bdellovibrionales bacterium]